ncbi:unnamed protein product [Ectocarpus sp. 13 AM-2016]
MGWRRSLCLYVCVIFLFLYEHISMGDGNRLNIERTSVSVRLKTDHACLCMSCRVRVVVCLAPSSMMSFPVLRECTHLWKSCRRESLVINMPVFPIRTPCSKTLCASVVITVVSAVSGRPT